MDHTRESVLEPGSEAEALAGAGNNETKKQGFLATGSLLGALAA